MLLAVPLIERRPLGGIGNGGADDEIGMWHWRFSRCVFFLVIPGRAFWRGPGIHTPDSDYGFRVRASARPGMTKETSNPAAPRHDRGTEQDDDDRKQLAVNHRSDQPQLPGA